jgi:hypothetical protein
MRVGPFQLSSLAAAGILAGAIGVSSGAFAGTAYSPSHSPSVDAARNAASAAVQSVVRDAREHAAREQSLRRSPSHRAKTSHRRHGVEWR